MDTEYWKSSPFGENSIFHPKWDEKESERRTTNITSTKIPTIALESGRSQLLLPIGIPHLIRLKVSGISKIDIGGKYSVELKCSDNRVNISTKKFEVEEGWLLLTFIESKVVCNTSLEIYVNKQKCNNISVKFLDSKDVFQKESIDSMCDELNYIAKQIERKTSSEYSGNYCMQAAERALSVLLNDTTDFYSVVRDTHKHRNNISFSGKTAYDRGNYFSKKGFVEKIYQFNNYRINDSYRKSINEAISSEVAKKFFDEHMYKFVSITDNEKKNIYNIFYNDLKDKETGYHIYYFTVTNGFHTMILIISNTNVQNPLYWMVDQHGLTSSYGLLKNIGLGFQRQTSWTFANTCLNRYENHKTQHYDSTETKLWKIKRK